MRNTSFRQLRVFCEVAKQLNFTHAATQLHLSPPAVTMQIKDLEEQLGFLLFDRDGKSISLTSGGEYMLVYAKRVLASLKDAQDMAAKLKDLRTGEICIGMVTTAIYFVPQILSRFAAEHPGVEVKLKIGNREKLTQKLINNDVDIAIMGRAPNEFAMRAEPFATHPLVFVAPASHALCKAKKVTPQDLQRYPLLVREAGSGTRATLERFLNAQDNAIVNSVEIPNNETIKQAIIANMGIGFLSLHTVGLELKHGLLHILPVQGTPIVRSWHLVHTTNKVLSPVAQAFRDEVLVSAEKYLSEEFGKFAKTNNQSRSKSN